MLYLSGSTNTNVVEAIMEQVAEKIEEHTQAVQAAAAQHIKKDFNKPKGAKPGNKHGAKTKAERMKTISKNKKLHGKKVDGGKPSKAEGPRLCIKCKEKKPRTPRSKRCQPCQKEVRTLQLARNNVTWRKRVEAGKAKHHATYRGKPTVWAATKPKEALKYAKEHGVLPVEKVKQAIDKYGKKIAEQATA